MGPSKYIDPLFAQQELSEKEVLLRKEFARLFCKSHNAYVTCIRLGFAQPYAADWASAFMDDCVVRHFIEEEQRRLTSEDGLKESRQEVLIKLRELGDFCGEGSSHAARVNAWTNVGKFLGMTPTKTETEVTYKGGVMMVPALTSPDEWGQAAEKSQVSLKEAVKD
jgi:hypothetical protein